MTNNYNEQQALAILRHAVATDDLALAARALRAYEAVARAQNRLDRMAGVYQALPSWDVLK